MQTEDKIIIGVAGIVAGIYIFNMLKNPDTVDQKAVNDYTIKAAIARNQDTWYAPLQGKQAIAETNADGSSTTYFIDDSDYNSMSRWERLLFSWDIPLKNIFGSIKSYSGWGK